MQRGEINGRQRLIVAGRVNRFIPNPTFDPVAKPGSLDDYFREQKAGDDIRAAFGDLEAADAAFHAFNEWLLDPGAALHARHPNVRVATIESGSEWCRRS